MPLAPGKENFDTTFIFNNLFYVVIKYFRYLCIHRTDTAVIFFRRFRVLRIHTLEKTIIENQIFTKMKRIKALWVFGILWTLLTAMPAESLAATPTTLTVVENDSSGIENTNYTATLSDGTILGFYAYSGWDYVYFCGAVSQNDEISVPDSISVEGWSDTRPVKYVGYSSCDFNNAESVVSLILPATVEEIHYLPLTLKTLHLNSLIQNDPWSNYLSSLENVLVPEEFLDQYLEKDGWRKYVLINAEGTSPLKITIDMTKPGEFAQLLLQQQTDIWYKVNDLTVKGAMNTDDLNVFHRMEQLIKLDLSGAIIEDIPDYFDGARSEGEYRDGFSLLETLILPELNSIGDYAFSQCYRLKDITIPKVNQIGRGAFARCGAKQITLPEGLTDIGDYAFYYSNFEDVTLPSTVTKLGSCCFFLSQLSSISLPESLKIIESYAFSDSNLKSIDLSHVRSIGYYAFGDCKQLTEVRFADGLTDIGSYSFSDCNALTELDLPSTLKEIGYEAFCRCTNIRNVTSRPVVPPLASYTMFSECDLTATTLHVPSMSIDTYRPEDGWKAFYTILPMSDKISHAYIYDDVTVNDASIFADGCDLTIDWQYLSSTYYTGALEYDGSSALSIHDYKQCHSMGGSGTSDSHYSSGMRSTKLIANGPMHAENIQTTFTIPTTYVWYFISLPYDVKVTDISYTDDTKFVIREYSGSNRAQQSGDTWLNLTAESVMHAYQGYILRCNKENAAFTFPAIDNANKDKVFEMESVVMPLAEYASAYDHNRSWNLIGNPYPCYYDTRFMDFTAPITVWNRYYERYDAYSPVDDSFILHPAQAFFVQHPADRASITFDKEGRQKGSAARDLPKNAAGRKSPGTSWRKIYNVTLSDGTAEDHTRFVINDNASRAYELDKDASKFITGDNRSMLVYTVEDGVRYAINERQLSDGKVSLGFFAPADGEYTLLLDTDEHDCISLSDKSTGKVTPISGGYRFYAMAGYNDARFTINIGVTDGIGTVIADSGADTGRIEVYTTDGRLLGSYSGDEISTLPRGVYIVGGKGVKRKIVVK